MIFNDRFESMRVTGSNEITFDVKIFIGALGVPARGIRTYMPESLAFR